jgi:hypothetical protein
MGTALSSLRVTAEMDTSGYVSAMAAKVAADQAGTASATALGVALAQTDAATQSSVPGVTSLSRQFIQGYSSAAQFENAVRRVGNAMDQGMNADLAGAMLDNVYRKFGLLTDASVLAGQGYVNLVPIIDNLNTHYLAQIEILNRATQAQEQAAAAAAYQAEINAKIGVGGPANGSAQASADAFMAQYGGLAGVAQAEAQQIADNFSSDLDSRLISGITKSAKDSAAVFQQELSQLDEIAQQQAQQAGAIFGDDLDARLISGVAKSAKDSASVFQAQFDELDEIAQLQAEQAGEIFAEELDARLISGITKSAKDSASVFQEQFAQLDAVAAAQAKQAGQNFQSSLNEFFGIGAAPKSASQSASIFAEADQDAAALENLKQQYDPVYAAQVKFAEAQQQINTLLAAGVINEEQFVTANRTTQAALTDTVNSINGVKTGSGNLQSAFNNLGYQMIAFSAGLGPLGMFLAGLGPWGLAAAAALGAVVYVIQSLAAGADDLAQQAIKLHEFSEATGLTTDQIQGLTQAGVQFGITSDAVTRGVQLMTANLGQAEQGTGALFTALLKVNPELALQVSAAKSAAEGWNIVAQAYKNYTDVGNIQGAAAIARGAFGRNGASLGPLLGVSADSGGIQVLSNQAKEAGGTLDDTLLPALQKLQAEIDVTNARAKVMMESIYGEDVLRSQLAFAQNAEAAAKALHDMVSAGGSGSVLGMVMLGQAAEGGYAPQMPTPVDVAKIKLAQGQGTSISPADVASWNALAGAEQGVSKATDGVSGSLQAQYVVLQKTISAMAGTATPAQQLQLKLLELQKATADHALTDEQAAKAQNLLTEAFNVTQLQANISAMGALVSPTQTYDLAVAKLKLDLDSGKISQDAFNEGVRASSLVLAQTTESIKEQYGTASYVDVLKQKYADMNVALQKVGATSNDYTTAQAKVLIQAKEVYAAQSQLGVQYAQQQQILSALGNAATPFQQLQQQILGVNKALDANILTAGQAAKATGVLYAEFNAQQLQQNVSAMGALASPTQTYTAAVAALKVQLDEGKISQYSFLAGVLNAKQTMNSSAEAIKEAYGLATPSDIASTQVTKFNDDMVKIGATAPQVAVGMVAVNKAIQNTSDSMKVLGSNTPNFTQLIVDLQNSDKVKDELLTSSGNALLQAAPAFVQALQQGQSISTAIAASLTGAANSIANAFATAGAKSIVSSISSGATSLFSPSSGSTAGADGTAAAGGASSVLNSLFNGGGGGMTSAALGAAQMGAGIGLSLVTGAIQKDQQAQQAWDQAQQAYQAVLPQINQFVQQMSGGGNGSLTSSLNQAESQAQSFADTAHKAGQSTNEINAALAQFADRTVDDFITSFDVMIGALNSGLGYDSPAVKAAQNVQSIGTQLEGFVEDTETVSNLIGGNAAAIQAAKSASQSYALSLLQTAPVLDSVETQFATIMGTAAQLKSVLQDLGMTADQAAASIQTGVTQAIASLQTSFTQTLQQQINSAQGNDWINQLQALEQTSSQNLSDASLLGTDPTMVVEAFQAQAQQIIDSAGLTGDAFQGLIKLFPELTGVVQQSSTAVAQEIQYYQQLQTQITSYINSLNVGSLSPLSPTAQLASAQQTYQQQLALAQSGNQDALNNFTNTASTYLNSAQSYYASGTGYAEIFNQVQQDLQNLVPTAEANDPLTQIATNTATTNQILGVLQTLNASTNDSSTTMSQALAQLGQQAEDVANTQSSQYFQPMTYYLGIIAQQMLTNGSAATAPQKSTIDKIFTGDWSNLQTGGIVGRFAPGGLVGNGLFNIDSVRARYATGGDIMLAGGEFVTRATSVNSATLTALQHINSTGRLPSNDNSAAQMSALGSVITQAIGAGAMAQISVMRDQIAGLRQDVRALNATFKSMKRPQRPGIKAA